MVELMGDAKRFQWAGHELLALVAVSRAGR